MSLYCHNWIGSSLSHLTASLVRLFRLFRVPSNSFNSHSSIKCFIVCFSASHSHFSEFLMFHFFTAHLPWSVRNLFKIAHSLLGSLTRVPSTCIRLLFATVPFSHEEYHFSMIVLFSDCDFSTAIQNGVCDLRRVRERLSRTEFIGNCWIFLYSFRSLFRNSSRFNGVGGIFDRIDSHGVGSNVPLIIRKVVFGRVSILLACEFRVHSGAQYSAAE